MDTVVTVYLIGVFVSLFCNIWREGGYEWFDQDRCHDCKIVVCGWIKSLIRIHSPTCVEAIEAYHPKLKEACLHLML